MSDPPASPPPGDPGFSTPTPNGLAVAALVTGVISLVLAFCLWGFGGLTGVVALLLGISGRRRIRESAGRETGEGLALAGMITGVIATALALLAVAFFLLAFAVGDFEFGE